MKTRFSLPTLILILFFSFSLFSCKKPKELMKKEWVVYSYKKDKNSDKEFPEKDKNYTLYFDGEGSYKFILDVNVDKGDVVFRSNNGITFKGGIITEICCDSNFSEEVSISILDAQEYKIKGNYLYLKNKDGLEIKFVQ